MRIPWRRKRNLVYVFRGEAPALPALPEGFECHECTPEIIEQYFADETPRHRRYLNFMQRGCFGYLIVSGDRWASVGWIAPADMSGMPLHIPRSASDRADWFFDDHTHPDFRGRGFQKYLVLRRVQYLRESGAGEDIVADVGPDNLPSRKSYRALGFVPAGWMTTFELRVPRMPRRLFGRWRSSAPHPPMSVEEQ